MEKFREATTGNSTPVQAIYYNDPQPDKIIYQALAWWKLGEPGKARNIFEKFIEFGRQHMNDRITIDYFAVSLPDMLVFDQDINGRNKTHCNYLIGLGHLGLGQELPALRQADHAAGHRERLRHPLRQSWVSQQPGHRARQSFDVTRGNHQPSLAIGNPFARDIGQGRDDGRSHRQGDG